MTTDNKQILPDSAENLWLQLPEMWQQFLLLLFCVLLSAIHIVLRSGLVFIKRL